MSEHKHVWPIDTGFTDLPPDHASLKKGEISSIAKIWNEQQDRLKGSENLLVFTEQLSREWAIETGIIENLYQIDRGVTQTLIERGFQAAILEYGSTNKPAEYVIQLLKDQQDALEGLFDFVSKPRPLSVSYIKELHAALCRNQSHVDAFDSQGKPIRVELIRGDWKVHPNYPERDGVIYNYCPPEQTATEMERLVELHNQHSAKGVNPEVEAAWLHHRFTIIHPFQDGNGRVARALASLVFIQRGLFPLVVTRDSKVTYLAALEAADGGALEPLVDLFAKLQKAQFRRATSISESILTQESGVKQAIQGLKEAVGNKEKDHKQSLLRVFEHAKKLEDVTEKQLGELAEEIESVLQQLDSNSQATIDRSNKDTDYYFRGQIIKVAENHLHYHADTGTYRSWIRLQLSWSRRAQFVFAFHSIGHRFAGVLLVAPFLEFRNDEDDNDSHSTLINLASEPFEIYYNETLLQAENRFEDWIAVVFTAMLAELQQNL